MNETEINRITSAILGSAIEVHRGIGAGLLESSYQACLSEEFKIRQIPFEREVPLPVIYKGVKLDCGYRIDFLVSGLVAVEIKAVETLLPIHKAQWLTYLRLGNWPVGLLINFNVTLLKRGIVRLVHGSLDK